MLTGNELTASKAFVAISLFNILRFPLVMLPNVIISLIQVINPHCGYTKTIYVLNTPRSKYQYYANIASRLSGQNSIFGVVVFISKSLGN